MVRRLASTAGNFNPKMGETSKNAYSSVDDVYPLLAAHFPQDEADHFLALGGWCCPAGQFSLGGHARLEPWCNRWLHEQGRGDEDDDRYIVQSMPLSERTPSQKFVLSPGVHIVPPQHATGRSTSTEFPTRIHRSCVPNAMRDRGECRVGSVDGRWRLDVDQIYKRRRDDLGGGDWEWTGVMWEECNGGDIQSEPLACDEGAEQAFEQAFVQQPFHVQSPQFQLQGRKPEAPGSGQEGEGTAQHFSISRDTSSNSGWVGQPHVHVHLEFADTYILIVSAASTHPQTYRPAHIATRGIADIHT